MLDLRVTSCRHTMSLAPSSSSRPIASSLSRAWPRHRQFNVSKRTVDPAIGCARISAVGIISGVASDAVLR
jgi:hypothetical protein